MIDNRAASKIEAAAVDPPEGVAVTEGKASASSKAMSATSVPSWLVTTVLLGNVAVPEKNEVA